MKLKGTTNKRVAAAVVAAVIIKHRARLLRIHVHTHAHTRAEVSVKYLKLFSMPHVQSIAGTAAIQMMIIINSNSPKCVRFIFRGREALRLDTVYLYTILYILRFLNNYHQQILKRLLFYGNCTSIVHQQRAISFEQNHIHNSFE